MAAAERASEQAARLQQRDRARTLGEALADVRRQLDDLVHPGFVTSAGTDRLADLLRYLEAVRRRLDRLPVDARRDSERQGAVARVQARYERFVEQVIDGTAPPGVTAGLSGIRWMIEELRVSLWAQSLGTPYPVSEERIMRAMDRMATAPAR